MGGSAGVSSEIFETKLTLCILSNINFILSLFSIYGCV